MIRKILVPLDGSALAETAIPQALAIARAFEAEVLLLRVQDTSRARPGALVDSVSWRLARAEALAYVRALTAKLGERGVRVQGTLAEGEAAEEILKSVREQAADLVVFSTHGVGGGESGFSVGGVAEKVLSRAGTSVFIVRGHEATGEVPAEIRYSRILVPLDGSQRAEWALLEAAPLARAQDGELLLVHVTTPLPRPDRTPPTAEEADLAHRLAERDRSVAERHLREMAELMQGSGVRVRTLLLDSPNVVQALQKVADREGVSLTVLSAHGCSGAAPWPYGSVADRLIHHGTMPLLVLQDLAAREESVEERTTALVSA